MSLNKNKNLAATTKAENECVTSMIKFSVKFGVEHFKAGFAPKGGKNEKKMIKNYQNCLSFDEQMKKFVTAIIKLNHMKKGINKTQS